MARKIQYPPEKLTRLEKGSTLTFLLDKNPVSLQLGGKNGSVMVLAPTERGMSIAWTNDDGHRQQHPITLNTFLELTIGAANNCDVRVDAAYVSRRHLKLTYEHGLVTLTDLNSTNGTQIQEIRSAASTTTPTSETTKILPQQETPKQEVITQPEKQPYTRLSTAVQPRREKDGNTARVSQDAVVMILTSDNESVLAVVCDGISSSPSTPPDRTYRPEGFAHLITEHVKKSPPNTLDNLATYLQDTAIRAVAELGQKEESATTLCALRIEKNGRVVIANVGDSEVLKLKTRREANGTTVLRSRYTELTKLTTDGEFRRDVPYNFSSQDRSNPLHGKM